MDWNAIGFVAAWYAAAMMVLAILAGLFGAWEQRYSWPRRIKTAAGEIVVFQSGATFAVADDGLVYRVINGVPRDAAPFDERYPDPTR